MSYVLSVEAIQIAFDALGPLAQATADAQAAVLALSPASPFPPYVNDDAGYNDPLASQETYKTDLATLRATFVTAYNAQIAAEAEFAALMPPQDYPGQWVGITGLTNWSPTTACIVGYPLSAVLKANNGQTPTGPQQIIPYPALYTICVVNNDDSPARNFPLY